MASPHADDQQQQKPVSSFLEVTDGESQESAGQHIEPTGWELNDAPPSPSSNLGATPSGREGDVAADEIDRCVEDDRREASDDDYDPDKDYDGTDNLDDEPYDCSNEESEWSDGWEPDYAESTSNHAVESRSLEALFRAPIELMYHGTFYEAKEEAALKDKWLLANLQCRKEFHSHMLNRDIWSNEPMAQVIQTNFIFWQVDDDTLEGKKVCNYYNLLSLPAILVIDPITGQKIRAWSGMVQLEELLEDLHPFMDEGPKEHLAAPQKHLDVIASMDATKDTTRQLLRYDEEDNWTNRESNSAGNYIFPPLPEEPIGSRELLCRIGIRFPNGIRLQRNFLHTDPVKLLWSFCCCQLGEGETRPFQLTQAIPGNARRLDYESDHTFGESSLSNSMIALTFGRR